jgi:hypothetical protein
VARTQRARTLTIMSAAAELEQPNLSERERAMLVDDLRKLALIDPLPPVGLIAFITTATAGLSGVLGFWTAGA